MNDGLRCAPPILPDLSNLADVCEIHNWVCHAYCLMDNHYQLLLETPDGNLSRGMRQLNGVYTQTHNRAHGRVGHVFQPSRMGGAERNPSLMLHEGTCKEEQDD